MQFRKFAVKLVLATSLTISPLVVAHSWVEQLMGIAPNGTLVGQPGYPRNNVMRTAAGFSDTAMVFLIPPNGGQINHIDAGQLMCRQEQTVQKQSDGSPRLKATPGQAVALRYQENGHVTLPQNQPGKPKGSGAVFVYMTTNSKADDKLLQIHRQWTPDGRGGDGRGSLISTQNFDDGQCYQINSGIISKQRQTDFKHQASQPQGADLWCQQDVQIPADAKAGTTVSLYWVWDWPTLPGTQGFPDGKQELYTTCMDIDIIAPPETGSIKAVSNGFVSQDVGDAAVQAQFRDVANPTAVKAQTIPFPGVSATSPSMADVGTTVSAAPFSVSQTLASQSTTSSSTTHSKKTVTVTVTATGPLQTTRIAHHRPAVTVTETETVISFVTVEATQGVNNKRNIDSDIPRVINSMLNVVETADPITSTSTIIPARDTTTMVREIPDQTSACSTAHQNYRLRARNPFYIIPSRDKSETNTGSAC